MRKILMFIFSFFIFSSFVYAINVTLVRPANGAPLEYEINNIQFICSAVGADVVKLFTTINGSWTQTGNSAINPTGGNATFLVPNVLVGTYKWNCLALSNEGSNWAPSNFTFSFSFPPNEPPVCNGTFPQITLQKNTPQLNVLNLKNYITDPNKDTLSFSFSGNNNIEITLKENGFIDLSPLLNRVATDTIYITASDGKGNDKQCGPLTVTIVDTSQGTNISDGTNASNTPPKITPKIPDQRKTEDVISWTVDLDDYVEDNGGKSSLLWSVNGQDNDIVTVSINTISHETTFNPVSVGSSTVTFIVKDSGGLSDEQDVIIEIMSLREIQENDTQGEVEIEPLKILSHIPGSSDPILEVGEELSFFITVNREDVDIVWYLDGEQIKENTDNFNFKSDKAGKYVIGVSVTKDGESDDYEWKVITNEKSVALFNKSCGDGIIDEGETCETCSDVMCKEGEECRGGVCVTSEKISPPVTGFVIFRNLLQGKIIGGIIGVVILVLFITLLIIRSKNKKKDRKLTSFEPKEKKSFLQLAKKEEPVLNVREDISKKTPSSIEPVIGFIQAGLASGDSEKLIKKALIRGGWNKKQIKQAFKSLRE